MEPTTSTIINFVFSLSLSPTTVASLSLPQLFVFALFPLASLCLSPLLLRYLGRRGGRRIFNMELGVAHLDLSGERKEGRKRDEGISPFGNAPHRIGGRGGGGGGVAEQEARGKQAGP